MRLNKKNLLSAAAGLAIGAVNGLLGAGGVTGVTGASGLAVPPVSPPEDELPPLLSGVVGRKGWFGVISPPVEGFAGVTDG